MFRSYRKLLPRPAIEFRSFANSAILFIAVGGIGFCIDASLLTVMMRFYGWPPVEARAVSFSTAVLVTWLLNRIITFREQLGGRGGSLDEIGRYAAIQLVGAAINFGIFSFLISTMPALSEQPIVPLAMGAAVSLVFTYGGSRWVAFKPGALARPTAEGSIE